MKTRRSGVSTSGFTHRPVSPAGGIGRPGRPLCISTLPSVCSSRTPRSSARCAQSIRAQWRSLTPGGLLDIALLDFNGTIRDSGSAKHSPVAFDLRWRACAFDVVVREFYCWPAGRRGELADQADGIELSSTIGITAAKIICEQSTPASTEANSPPRHPLGGVVKIHGRPEVFWRHALLDRSGKIGVESEDRIHIERVRRDDELIPRFPSALPKPLDVFVASDVRVFAVDTLPRPICSPVGRILEKLCCAKSIGKQDE